MTMRISTPNPFITIEMDEDINIVFVADTNGEGDPTQIFELSVQEIVAQFANEIPSMGVTVQSLYGPTKGTKASIEVAFP